MPEPRDSTARPRRQKKPARVATSPARMPWPMRLVFLVCARGPPECCRAADPHGYPDQNGAACRSSSSREHMPEVMGKQLVDNAREDARLQEALDAQRQTSWWAWLITPAHPPRRGCCTPGASSRAENSCGVLSHETGRNPGMRQGNAAAPTPMAIHSFHGGCCLVSRRLGASDHDIHQITVENPRRFFEGS